MLMFCSSCKEEGTSSDIPTTSTETAPVFKGTGAILEGLADCLASRGNGAPKTLVCYVFFLIPDVIGYLGTVSYNLLGFFR